jgi:hypothetical protein
VRIRRCESERSLRRYRLHQIAPAAFGLIAVVTTGSDSRLWWIALGSVLVRTLVSSAALTLGAVAVTYLVATLVRGPSAVADGEAGVLARPSRSLPRR